MGCGGGGYEPDTYAQEKQAEISREQYDDYQAFYGPIEDKTISYLKDDKGHEEEVAEAGTLAGKAYDTSSESMQRNLGRYGIKPSADVAANLERDNSRNKTLAVVDAKNRTRETVDTRKTALTEEMIGIGKGIQSDYNKTMSAWTQAESTQNQVDAQKAAASAANRNSMFGTAATLGFTAAMFF